MARFLVVDDDHSTVSALTTLLQQDGHEVASMTSGREAVSALRGGGKFDVVVTDFEMPAVDGTAVARAARASSPDACILVLGRGRADPHTLREAGACALLEKPIQYEALHGVVATCRKHGGRGGPQCVRHHLGPGGTVPRTKSLV
jgi:CheY-like chemotaxis protein